MQLFNNIKNFGSSTPKVFFTCTRLQGTSKKGILKPDENGYYDHPLGGLNVHNSSGAFYEATESKKIFETSSKFMRQVKRGVIYAELGHPSPRPNESEESYLNRCLQIDPKNTIAHIHDVWLDFDNFTDPNNNQKIIGIMGKVKPFGVHAKILQDALDNPKQNTCFSVRSFTDDKIIDGVLVKALKTVVNFDYVLEPGIVVAEKFFSPSLENFKEIAINKSMIENMYEKNHCISLESSFMSKDDLLNILGLEEDPTQPSFSNW